MENKFSRDFVAEYDRKKEERERQIRESAPPPPRVVIPQFTGEKHGMEYTDMRVFVLKVLLGAIGASVAFFSALYYFSNH